MSVKSLQAGFWGRGFHRVELHLGQCPPEEEEAALCPLPQGHGVFGAAQAWGAEPRQELRFGAD